MGKEDRKKADSLADAIGDIGLEEEATGKASEAKESLKSKDAGPSKAAKAKKRAPDPEPEDVEGSTSFYWHSFLLLSGRLLNRMLDWYNGIFSFTAKDKAKLYRNISQHYLKRGAPGKAMSYLKEWARNEKGDPEPVYQMAVALASLGEYQRAVNVFDRVLKIKPNHLIAIYRRSAILLKLKNFKEAINGLVLVIAETPDDPRAYYLLGLAYDGDGQLDKGVEAMQKAVDLDPEEIKYHQYLGFMNVRKEDHKTAAEHFTKVMELERAQEEEAE